MGLPLLDLLSHCAAITDKIIECGIPPRIR